MSFSAWRITKQEHTATAFSGEGARLYGGRWNSPGVSLVYTAQSRALAALEMLVHLESPALLKKYLLFEVSFDSSYVQQLSLDDLPTDWRSDPPPSSTQAIGDAWATSLASPVMLVPSVLIPGESNFLLNPRHSQFPELRIGDPVPFEFDPRLVTRKAAKK